MSVLAQVAAPFGLSRSEFDQLVLPVGNSGLPLGHGLSGRWAGQSVVLDVLRSRSTHVSSFLDIGIAVVLARRLQRSGASVAITNQEPGWQALLRLSQGDPTPVVVAPASPTGSFLHPAVEVGTAQPLVGASTRPDRPWSTTITMLPQVDLRSTTQAREADLTLIGQTSTQKAGILRSVLGLGPAAVSDLEGLSWDQIVVVAGRSHTVVRLDLTTEELRLRAATSGWQRARRRRGLVQNPSAR
jgi:hypothetical protein